MLDILGFLLLGAYLLFMLILVQIKKDTSIGNVTWVGGVLLVTLYTFLTKSNFLFQQIFITLLITIWAIRLLIHTYMRYTGKDPRFVSWTWQGFKALMINIGWVFGQIIMIALMSYPAYLINSTPYAHNVVTWLDLIGLCIWLYGFYYEAVSDYQLLVFMRNPENKGHVIRSGLWRYSRHPNYFGEIMIWWGIFCIAVSVPYGITAIIAPLTITCFLLFITGIPWIEKAMEHNPEYQEYKKTTPMLFPWFIKK